MDFSILDLANAGRSCPSKGDRTFVRIRDKWLADKCRASANGSTSRQGPSTHVIRLHGGSACDLGNLARHTNKRIVERTPPSSDNKTALKALRLSGPTCP